MCGISNQLVSFVGIGYGENSSENRTCQERDLIDFNGDGVPDLLKSTGSNHLEVCYAHLGRTGLLKTVTTPLGGSITLGYRQTEANVFHSRRWVMDTLLVCDSLPGDGADTRMTTWTYEKGFYDRVEREFLGFAMVTEKYHETSSNNTIKRTYTRYFRNDSIQTKGLMICEEIRNGRDSLYVVTANRYGSRTLNRDGNVSANARLSSRSNQLASRFQEDMQELLAEATSISSPVVMTVNSLNTTATATDIFYYHTNHLGSTAYVTDQNQNITQGFLYAPFGEITTEYAPMWQNGTLPKYAFNAKELDEETGMYYYEARYYKPPVFTSRDPMFEKKPWLSPYHYCSNNPVGRVDPSGMLDDWYEDANGCILWTDCRSQKEMYENEIYGRYLGQAHIVFTGSRWEKGGPKDGKGNYIDGDGTCNAHVTVYGPKNANDIHYFTGYTMTSNAEKFIPIDEGLYDGVLGDKGGVLPSIWALKGNIRTIDGVPNTNPESKGDWNYNTSWKTGIFIHSTGSGGNLGTRNSTGCLLILDSEWSEFNKVLENVTTFSVRVQRYAYGYIPLEGVNGQIPNVFVQGTFLKK